MFSMIRSKHALASLYRIALSSFCMRMVSLTSTIAVAVSAAFLPGRPPACSGAAVFSLHAIKLSLYAMKNLSMMFQSAS